MTTDYLKKSILRNGRRIRRAIRSQQRRVISSILIFTFTLTMTGMNTVVANAWDWNSSLNNAANTVKSAANDIYRAADNVYKDFTSNNHVSAGVAGSNYPSLNPPTWAVKNNNISGLSNRTEAVNDFTSGVQVASLPQNMLANMLALGGGPVAQALNGVAHIPVGASPSIESAKQPPDADIPYPLFSGPEIPNIPGTGEKSAKPADTNKPPTSDMKQSSPGSQTQPLRQEANDQPKPGQATSSSQPENKILAIVENFINPLKALLGGENLKPFDGAAASSQPAGSQSQEVQAALPDKVQRAEAAWAAFENRQGMAGSLMDVTITTADGKEITRSMQVDTAAQRAFYQENNQLFVVKINDMEKKTGEILSVEGLDTEQFLTALPGGAGSSIRFYGTLALDKNNQMLIPVPLEGKTAYRAMDGTTYIGTQEKITSGSYQVIGRNMFQESAGEVSYTATYEKHMLQNVVLGNGKKITEFGGYNAEGDPTSFKVRETSKDETRTAIAVYQDGKLQGTEVTLKNFRDQQGKALILSFDKNGDITQECLAGLKAEGGNFTFETTPSGGFKLIPNDKTKKEEVYTATGCRILSGEGESSAQSAMVEFNVKKNITLNIAKYADKDGVNLKMQEITKQQVTVSTSENGLIKTVIKNSMTAEVAIYGTDAWSEGSSKWVRVRTMGTEQGLINGQYVDAGFFKQLETQEGGLIKGVTNIEQQPLTDDNGLYMADGNGGLRFTGVVAGTEIEMTAGLTLNNFVEMTGGVVPEDMVIAGKIGVSETAITAVTSSEHKTNFAGKKRDVITGEHYKDTGMVTFHRVVGEDGQVTFSLDGTYTIEGTDETAKFYAAVDEENKVLNIARAGGDEGALKAIGAPDLMIEAAKVDASTRTMFGEVEITDESFVSDGGMTIFVSTAPDKEGEYSFSMAGDACEGEMGFVAAWKPGSSSAKSYFDISEAELSPDLIDKFCLEKKLPDTIKTSAESGETYIGGMGVTETNTKFLGMPLETFGKEAATRINNVDYVNKAGKVKIFLGKDGDKTTYGLAGVGKTLEGNLNIISMLNTDTEKMEIAHVHGCTDAMRSFGLPSILVDKIEGDKNRAGNVWVGNVEQKNVQFMHGNGVATIDIVRQKETGNTRFMVRGKRGDGVVLAELKAEFMGVFETEEFRCEYENVPETDEPRNRNAKEMIIMGEPRLFTGALGNFQAVTLIGDEDFLLGMSVSQKEIDGLPKTFEGNEVEFVKNGKYEVSVSEHSYSGEAIFSPVGVIETDKGNIIVRAGMNKEDEMKIQTGSGPEEAFRAAGIGEELLDMVKSGKVAAYTPVSGEKSGKKLKIIYEQDGMINLGFSEEGDSVFGIIKIDIKTKEGTKEGKLEVTTTITTKRHLVLWKKKTPGVRQIVGTDEALTAAGITVQHEHSVEGISCGEVKGEKGRVIGGVRVVSMLGGIGVVLGTIFNDKTLQPSLVMDAEGDETAITYRHGNKFAIVTEINEKTGVAKTEAVAGTAMVTMRNGKQVEVSVLTTAAGITAAFVDGKNIGAVDARTGKLILAQDGERIIVANTHTSTIRSYDSNGLEKTGYTTSVFNAQNEAVVMVSDAWKSGVQHGVDAWKGVDAGYSLYRVVGCMFAVIGNAIMGGIIMILAPLTAGLNFMADNWFRDAGAWWFTKSLGAAAYFCAKFLSQNLILVAVIAASAVCPAVGVAFLGVMAMAEMTKGIVGGVLAMGYNFFVHPFIELWHGASLLWHNSWDVDNAYNVADNALVFSAATLGMFFAFMMGGQFYRYVKPTAQIIAVGFVGRIMDMSYRSKSEFKPESNRVAEICRSEKSTFRKSVELRELYKEADVTGRAEAAKRAKDAEDVTTKVEKGQDPLYESGRKNPGKSEGTDVVHTREIKLEPGVESAPIWTGNGGSLTFTLAGKAGKAGKAVINIKVNKNGDVTLRFKNGEAITLTKGGKVQKVTDGAGKVVEISRSKPQKPAPEVALLEGMVNGASKAFKNAETAGAALRAVLKHTQARENLAKGLKATRSVETQKDSILRRAEDGYAEGAKVLRELMKNPDATTIELVKSLETAAKEGYAEVQGVLAEAGRAIGRDPAMAKTMFKNKMVSKSMAKSMFEKFGEGKKFDGLVKEICKSSEAAGNLLRTLEGKKAEDVIKKAAEMDTGKSAGQRALNLAQNSRPIRGIIEAARQDPGIANKIYDMAIGKNCEVLNGRVLNSVNKRLPSGTETKGGWTAKVRNSLRRRPKDLSSEKAKAISKEDMLKFERFVDAAEQAALKKAAEAAAKAEGAKPEPAKTKTEPRTIGDKIVDLASYIRQNPVAFTRTVFEYISGMKLMHMGMGRLGNHVKNRRAKALQKLKGKKLLKKFEKTQDEIKDSKESIKQMEEAKLRSDGRLNRVADRVVRDRPVKRLIKEMENNARLEARRAQLDKLMSDMEVVAKGAAEKGLSPEMEDMIDLGETGAHGKVIRELSRKSETYIEANIRLEEAGSLIGHSKKHILELKNQVNKAAADVIQAKEAADRSVEALRSGSGGPHAETAKAIFRRIETREVERLTQTDAQHQRARSRVERETENRKSEIKKRQDAMDVKEQSLEQCDIKVGEAKARLEMEKTRLAEAKTKLAEAKTKMRKATNRYEAEAAHNEYMEAAHNEYMRASHNIKQAKADIKRAKSRSKMDVARAESEIRRMNKILEPLDKLNAELQQRQAAKEKVLNEIIFLGRQAGVAERLISSQGSVELIATMVESMPFESQVEILRSVDAGKRVEIMRSMSFEGVSEFGRLLSWKEVIRQADALIKSENYQVAGDLLSWRTEIFKGKPGERIIDNAKYAKALEQSVSPLMEEYAKLNSKKVVDISVIDTLRDFGEFLDARPQLSLEAALKEFNIKNSESRPYLDARQLKLTDRNSVDTCLDTLITSQSKAARTKLMEAGYRLVQIDARIDRARSLGREAEARQLEKQYAQAKRSVRRHEIKAGEKYAALPNTKIVIKIMDILRTESARDLALEMSEFMQKKPGESDKNYNERLQKGLKDADMTEAFIKAWETIYEPIYKTEFQGKTKKIEQYRVTMDGYREKINKVMGPKKGEAGYQCLDGRAMYERFIKLRGEMIKNGELKSGSIEDFRFNRVYGEIAFTRVTGYSGMRLAQKVMLSEFFGGNNVGLKAGGGKTNVFIMFPGLARMMTGKALRAELLVDDASAIMKYIDGDTQSGLRQGELAKAFGIELKNGMELYETGKQNGYAELIKALRDPNHVVILDHTSRAHLRNAEVSNPALRAALRETNCAGIDEVHMAATSQTSAIIGGKVSAPDAEMVRRVGDILTKLDFNYDHYKNTNGEVMLGNGFKVQAELRGQSMYDPSPRVAEKVKNAAESPDRIIMLTKEGPKVNGGARQALRQFTAAEIEATLKTLFSKQGKAGEYNPYIINIKDGLIYPVDSLGESQLQQISHDVVGQITAAYINEGVNPYTAVRVSETSMQTPLSAMYRGNFGALIVGSAATVEGIENLMKNKIGSGTTHISTSKLDVRAMIYETDGRILTSNEAGDSIVSEAIKTAKHDGKVLVFEADPVAQIKKVGDYSKLAKKPVISIMNVGNKGYYVPEGTAKSFIRTYGLENAKIADPPNGVKVDGYEYIKIAKNGVQTIVKNTNKIANQIVIINEMGATGKDYQCHMTLVVRKGHTLTADVLTQLLLRTGRGGMTDAESWSTTRYVCVDAKEMQNTVDAAKGKLTEITKIAEGDNNADKSLIKLLESNEKTEAEDINLKDSLEINARYKHMELIGDSSRFSVQDAVRDIIVVNPFKQILGQIKNPSATAAGRILETEQTRILNPVAAENADIMLRSSSGQTPAEINRGYAYETFRASKIEAKKAWRNVLTNSIRNPNAWFSKNILYSSRQLIRLYVSDLYVRPGKTKTYEVRKDAILAETRNLRELYQLSENMMKRVLSRETGGAEMNAMRNQVSRITEAVKDSKVTLTKAEQTTLQKTWKESHKQYRNYFKPKSGISGTVAMIAQALNLKKTDETSVSAAMVAQALNLKKTDGTPDLDTASLIMAPTYSQAVRMIQGDLLLLDEKYTGQETSVIQSEVQKIGVGRIGTFMRSLPLLHVLLQIWDDRAMTRAEYHRMPQVIEELEELIHRKQAAAEPVTTEAAAAGVANAAALAVQAAEQEVITYQSRSMTLEEAKKYIAGMQAGQADLQERYAFGSGQRIVRIVGRRVVVASVPITVVLLSSGYLILAIGVGIVPAVFVAKKLYNKYWHKESPFTVAQRRLNQLSRTLLKRLVRAVTSPQTVVAFLMSIAFAVLFFPVVAMAGTVVASGAAMVETVTALGGLESVVEIAALCGLAGIVKQDETMDFEVRKKPLSVKSDMAVGSGERRVVDKGGTKIFPGGVVQTWKKRMGKSRDGAKAWRILTEIMSPLGVELNAAGKAQTYGLAYLMAALFDLVPAFEVSGDAEVVPGVWQMTGIKAHKPGINSVNIAAEAEGAEGINVDASALPFFEQRLSDMLLNSAVRAAVRVMLTKSEQDFLNSLLLQSHAFKDDSHRVNNFITQYIMNGEDLRKMVNANPAELQPAYDLVAEKFGHKFTEIDLKEFNLAMLEIERGAYTRMAVAAAAIESASDSTVRAAREAEFESAFGISYAEYEKMMTPPLVQRIMQLAFSADYLGKKDQPTANVKTAGKKIFGRGAVAIIGGVVLATAFTGVLPIVAGAAVLAAGAAACLEGALVWAQSNEIAFNINPSDAVTEQLAAANFEPVDPGRADAKKISMTALLKSDRFENAIKNLGIGETGRVSKEMQTRAIRYALEHLVTVVGSDATIEAKIALTEDIVRVLAILQFQVNMKYDSDAYTLKVQLTPETMPRTLTFDSRTGSIIEILKGMGIDINLQAPINKPKKLKSTGRAA